MSGRILRFLEVWNPEKRYFFPLFFANFFLMGAVFFSRTVRDALFYVHAGYELLPVALISVVPLVALVSARIPGLLDKHREVRVTRVGLAVIGILALACAGAVSWVLGNKASLPDWLVKGIMFVLFGLVEVAAFVTMQFFGAISERHFTTKQMDRLFPKFIGGGHLGIALGGLIAIIFSSRLNRPELLVWAWPVLIVATFLFAWIATGMKPSKGESDSETSLSSTPSQAAAERKKNGFLKVLSEPYPKVFALITICTFFVGAFFDFAVAKTSKSAFSDDAGAVVMWLGVITASFGFVAAFIQFTFMTRWIRRYGVKKVNVVAPVLLTVGSGLLTVFTFPTAAIARFLYLSNEFIFNQTLIQWIYGAVRPVNRARVRFAIEGPITFGTIALAGTVLLLPVFFTGFLVEWAVLLAFAAACMMLVLSLVLKERYGPAVERATQDELTSATRQSPDALIGLLSHENAAVRNSAIGLGLEMGLDKLPQFRHRLLEIAMSPGGKQEGIAALAGLRTIRDSGFADRFKSAILGVFWRKPDATELKANDTTGPSESFFVKVLNALPSPSALEFSKWKEGNYWLRSADTREELVRYFESGGSRDSFIEILTWLSRSKDSTVSLLGLKSMALVNSPTGRRRATELILEQLGSTSVGDFRRGIEIAAELGIRVFDLYPLIQQRAKLVGPMALLASAQHCPEWEVQSVFKVLRNSLSCSESRTIAVTGLTVLAKHFPDEVTRIIDAEASIDDNDPAREELKILEPRLLSLIETRSADNRLVRIAREASGSRADEALRILAERASRQDQGDGGITLFEPSDVGLVRGGLVYQVFKRLLNLTAIRIAWKSLGNSGGLGYREINRRIEECLAAYRSVVALVAAAKGGLANAFSWVSDLDRRDRIAKDASLSFLENNLPEQWLYEDLQSLSDATDFWVTDSDLLLSKLAALHQIDEIRSQSELIERLKAVDEKTCNRLARFEFGLLEDDTELLRISDASKYVILTELSFDSLRAIIDVARPFSAKTWHVLASEQDPLDSIYFIAHGKILELHKDEDSSEVSAPCVLGAIEQIAGVELWDRTLVAGEDIEGFVIPASAWARLMLADSGSQLRVAEALAGMVARWNDSIDVQVSSRETSAIGLRAGLEKFLGLLPAGDGVEVSDSTPMELERKYTVDFDPNFVVAIPGARVVDIEQYYLSIEPESEVRLRKKGEKAIITIKGAGGLARSELESETSAEVYECMKGLAAGGIIRKTRYIIPIEPTVLWELDDYHGELKGLQIAEVEIADTRQVPNPPQGVIIRSDVTENFRFKNKYLSLSSGGLIGSKIS
jgi:CYTH domain-containing protein/ATP/ADP translocase/CRP-like cAMP-binding protein